MLPLFFFLISAAITTFPLPAQIDKVAEKLEERGEERAAPALIISATTSLLDEDVSIQIKGVRPKEIIRLVAQANDDKGLVWQSFALFQADHLGSIDVSQQAPLSGSYTGVDIAGLFWSLQPSNKQIGASFKVQEQFTVTLTAYRDEKVLASQTLTKHLQRENIEKIELREDGLTGVLFMPKGLSQATVPAIITLTGSNGGISPQRAQALANHGFAVLALAYFAANDLPPTLHNIPLEYFTKVVAWLKKQPHIDSRIGLYGVSRGAELALILGSYFPDSIQAIVAAAPSSVIYGGFNLKESDEKDFSACSAWIYQGQPIAPFLPLPPLVGPNLAPEEGKSSKQPLNTTSRFLSAFKEHPEASNAAIQVEKIKAALLLISGGDDQMWPSAVYAQQIIKRLELYRSGITYEHLHYLKAGHGINLPNLPQPGPLYYHPIAKRWFSMGGTAQADQEASRDCWPQIVRFFHQQLYDKENRE